MQMRFIHFQLKNKKPKERCNPKTVLVEKRHFQSRRKWQCRVLRAFIRVKQQAQEIEVNKERKKDFVMEYVGRVC